MDQAFYIGAVGAHQQMRHLNVQADNVANVKTVGFKANKARFVNLMYQKDSHVAVEQLQDKGVGTKLLMTSSDFGQGAPSDTGRFLDYMIDGDGFFAVQDLTTGEISYTRNGAFKMAERLVETGATDENGEPVIDSVYYLSDGAGRFVLDQNLELIEITDTRAELPIGVFDFDNYDGMINLGGTYFQPVAKNGERQPGTGTLIQKNLEMSNMDLAEALTKVIEAQRAYGMALKVMQTSDEVETTINNLRS